MTARERVEAALADGRDARWFRAPGRVNLIGDHTDYNEGFVLPLAIDLDCVVAARGADEVRARSLDGGGDVVVPADGSAEPASADPPWGRYVAGVVRALGERGRPAVGVDAVLASDVPLGSGLSSSAALEVAVALALADAAGWQASVEELAEGCRAAEEAATGVPCGIMDQLTSLAGKAGCAVLIDCRSRELRHVGLPGELAVLAVHSGMPRTLERSAYAERRRACEELARKLGIPALRDAAVRDVAGEPLGRHVVSENARVLRAVDALGERDPERLGAILSESHASLRDDFRVSTAELDVLVEELVGAGAYGARLTGAGFGGSVVAACAPEAVASVAETATVRYRTRTGLRAIPMPCRAVDGAGPLPALT